MRQEILRMECVTTVQNEITQLDNFSLHIFQGEIMGLVCINSNGEESLIDLIQHNLPLHYGRMYFCDTLVNTYQHSTMTLNKAAVIDRRCLLVDDLTVTDNVFVIRKGFRKFLISPRVLNAQLRRFTEPLGIKLDGSMLVKDLTVYERYLVELLRAVVMGAKLIVIRDISNSVSAENLSCFFKLLRHYATDGLTFLYICNHHEEAFKICDRIAMMRDGGILKVLERNDFEDGNILPYYQDMFADFGRERVQRRGGREFLSFRNVCTSTLDRLTFSILEGECTTLLDLDNTVLDGILGLMNGELRADSGFILLDGKKYTFRTAKHAVANGVEFIAENPSQSMLFRELSVADNLCFLAAEKRRPIRLSNRVRRGILKELHPFLGEAAEETNPMRLKLSSVYNLIYLRTCLGNPKIVFCVQPFAGADLLLRREIISHINRLKEKNITVVILAVNFSDTLMVTDRLITFRNGTFRREYRSEEFGQFQTEGITP